jgi:hypothetical protein
MGEPPNADNALNDFCELGALPDTIIVVKPRVDVDEVDVFTYRHSSLVRMALTLALALNKSIGYAQRPAALLRPLTSPSSGGR